MLFFNTVFVIVIVIIDFSTVFMLFFLLLNLFNLFRADICYTCYFVRCQLIFWRTEIPTGFALEDDMSIDGSQLSPSTSCTNITWLHDVNDALLFDWKMSLNSLGTRDV